MFQRACLRLAGIYLIAIMACCLLTSVWIYQLGMRELKAGLSASLDAQVQKVPAGEDRRLLKQTLAAKTEEGSRRIMRQLLLFNTAAFVLGGPGSYALARRMLRPVDEAMRAQNRFTADASHELRTPLAAMKSQTELAILEDNYTKERTQQLLKSNLEEINHLSELTEGLLLLANDKPVATDQTTQLDAAIERVCKRLQPLAHAKHINLQREVLPVAAVGSTADIERLVTILVDNAVKYSPEQTTVSITVKKEDQSALLAVADQGQGISPADLPHIFDRFYRADNARSRQATAGHGLGLALAQKIAHSLGGSIDVKSTESQGSLFTVRLPLKNSPLQ